MECSTQIQFGCQHCKCFVQQYEDAMIKAEEAQDDYWAQKELEYIKEMGL